MTSPSADFPEGAFLDTSNKTWTMYFYITMTNAETDNGFVKREPVEYRLFVNGSPGKAIFKSFIISSLMQNFT